MPKPSFRSIAACARGELSLAVPPLEKMIQEMADVPSR